MNIQEGIKELESHKMKSEDIRAIRYNDGINAGIAVMKKLDEPQKPVVPKCAEPFLKEAKCSTDVIQLFVDILHATDSDGFIWENWKWTADFYEWLAKDSDTLYILCDALRYGYEVEKEPLYRVKLGEGYFVEYQGRGALIMIIPDDNKEIKIFDSKSDAERTAQTIGGTVEEVAEG